MGSVLSSTAFTFCVRQFMAVLIYSVHCIHGGTALIFRMLCPWLYEVFFQFWPYEVASPASNGPGYFVWPKLWSPFKKKQVEVKWIHSSLKSRHLCWKRFVTALNRITDLLFLKTLKPDTPSNSSNSNQLIFFYSYNTRHRGSYRYQST